ncbi:MAG: hypothetical protein ABEI96_07780 [Haloarculaceae archaeon]
MSLSALDSIDDALDATKAFLLPFDRVTWLRLAVVMFFVGGGGFGFNVPNLPSGGDVGNGAGPSPGGMPTPDVTGAVIALVVGVIVVVLLIVLALQAVGAVMEFVFVDALRSREVRLRSPLREHWWAGMRLFAFRVLFGLLHLLVLAAVGLGLVALVLGFSPAQWSLAGVLGLLALAIPLLVLDYVVVGNVMGFTTVFVVPVMLAEDRTVLSAWKRLFGVIKREWREFLVYAVVGFLLGIAAGLARGLLALLGALVVAIPFLIVGVPLFAVAGFDPSGVGPVVGAALVVLGVVYVLVVFVLGLVLKVPFQTFLRYYALLVLGDAEPDVDVVEDVRTSVRGE